MSVTKIYFIPADVMPLVRIHDCAEGEYVAPTEAAAYYAVAGVGNPTYIVVADDNLVKLSDVTIAQDVGNVGTVLSYNAPGYNLPVTEVGRVWEEYDISTPSTIIAFSNAATYTIPDVGTSTTKQVRIKITSQDYLGRQDVSTDFIDIVPAPVTGTAPSYPVGAVASLSGTGVVGSTGTATVSAAATGSPTPTITWEFTIDDVAQAEVSSAVFTYAAAHIGKDISVSQVARNANGVAKSLVDPTPVRVADAAPNWVVFDDTDWSIVELQTTPEGRLEITINSGMPSLPVGYSFYISTSANAVLTPTSVRQNGIKFTATGVFTTAAKVVDSVIHVNIIQIKDPAAGVTPSDSDPWQAVGTKPDMTITGIITVTPPPPTDYAEFPGPSAALIADALAEQAEADIIWRTDADAGTNKAYANNSVLIVFHGAYYGDAACITSATNLMKKWATGRASNSFLASETGLGPVLAFGYQAQYENNCMACIECALNTPVIYNALSVYQLRGFYAAFEWCVYAGAFIVGVGNPPALRGRVAIGTMGGVPNISAGNAMLFNQGILFFKTQLGKEWLAYRGFASVDAMMKAFDKATFLTFLKSNAMKEGGVATGLSVCANLISTVDWANKSVVGAHNPATVPTNADMKAQVNKGNTWRAKNTQHTIDDLQGFTYRYINNIYGTEQGGPSDYGVELGGVLGPRIIHAGVNWAVGYAVDSTVTPNPTRTVKVAGKSTTKPCTSPDNAFGVPIMSSSTHAFAVSGNTFTNRRGVPIGSGANYPFIGQSGCPYEMYGGDAGSDPYGMRVSASYTSEGIAVGSVWLATLGVAGVGPRNFQPNPGMGVAAGDTPWTESDANIARIAAATGFRSASAFQWSFLPALTGYSGPVSGPASPVKANVDYMFAWQTKRLTGTSHRVRARVQWYTSGMIAIGTPVVLSAITETPATNTVLEQTVVVKAPATAAFSVLLLDVEQAITNGNVQFGGVLLRYKPQVFAEWDNPTGKACAERARRGMLYFRAVCTSGWKSAAKMCYPVLIGGQAAGQQSNVEDWTVSNSGNKYRWNCLLGMPIQQIIPWWRSQIQGYPAYGAGYTGPDWEGPVNFSY